MSVHSVVCILGPSVRTQHITAAPSVAVRGKEVLNKFVIAEIELAIGNFVLVSLHFDLTFWFVASSIASIVPELWYKPSIKESGLAIGTLACVSQHLGKFTRKCHPALLPLSLPPSVSSPIGVEISIDCCLLCMSSAISA